MPLFKHSKQPVPDEGMTSFLGLADWWIRKFWERKWFWPVVIFAICWIVLTGSEKATFEFRAAWIVAGFAVFSLASMAGKD